MVKTSIKFVISFCYTLKASGVLCSMFSVLCVIRTNSINLTVNMSMSIVVWRVKCLAGAELLLNIKSSIIERVQSVHLLTPNCTTVPRMKKWYLRCQINAQTRKISVKWRCTLLHTDNIQWISSYSTLLLHYSAQFHFTYWQEVAKIIVFHSTIPTIRSISFTTVEHS